MRIPVALSLVLAALSLLVLDQTTYDPTAWLIWGRQIAHGTLETVAGPSWKPLPVLFTTPFSLFGDDGAIWLWLVVARVGGLLSFVVAYRVAARLGGRAAGVVAVIALVLAAQYDLNWIRGNSEGLLVLFGLLAVDRHLDERPGQALAAAVAAALVRPEVWPLLGLYGLWLLHRRRDVPTLLVVTGAGALVLLAWFVPEYIGSGDFFRGATRAREPVAGSPGASDNPFLATFSHSAPALSYGVYAGAVAALVPAWRDRRVAAIAVGSALLMLLVAALASSGFTGNIRYVALPMSLLCVLSGIGWAWVGGRVPRTVLAVLVLAAAPGLVSPVVELGDDLARAADADRFYGALPGFIERLGGREAVKRCGQVATGPYNTQALAWRLHTREQEIALRPQVPGSVLDSAQSLRGAGNRAYRLKLRGTEWMLRSTC